MICIFQVFMEHLWRVLKVQRENILFSKFSNCKSRLLKMPFLGYVVPNDDIVVDLVKIKSVIVVLV